MCEARLDNIWDQRRPGSVQMTAVHVRWGRIHQTRVSAALALRQRVATGVPL